MASLPNYRRCAHYSKKRESAFSVTLPNMRICANRPRTRRKSSLLASSNGSPHRQTKEGVAAGGWSRNGETVSTRVTNWHGDVSVDTARAARTIETSKRKPFAEYEALRGSVVGTIQVRGSGPVRSASLPAGTLRVKGDTVCASLSVIPIEPCFDLNKTDDQSFRGSISGLDSAYCDFTQLSDVAVRPRRHRPGPLSLDPARWRRAAP